MQALLLSALLCGLGGGASSSVSTTSPAVPQVARRYVFAPAGSTPKGTFGEPVTVTRASSKSCLVGGIWTQVDNNVGCIGDAGLSVEGSRTQYALNNCTTPADQTVTLAAGAHTLWLEGSGSVAAAVGTATATGLPCTATAASACSFTVTVGGTVTLDATGTVDRMQVENGAKSSLICATTTPVTRAADVVTHSAPVWLCRSVTFTPSGSWLTTVSGIRGLMGFGANYSANSMRIVTEINTVAATVFDKDGGVRTFRTPTLTFDASSSHSIKVCYAPNDVRVWLDGAAATMTASGSGTGTITTTPTTLAIGSTGSGGFFFDGSVTADAVCTSPNAEDCR